MISNIIEFSFFFNYRQSCKTEKDADILEATQNVLIPLEQILYMLDDEKNIHFKLRIHEEGEEDNNGGNLIKFNNYN